MDPRPLPGTRVSEFVPGARRGLGRLLPVAFSVLGHHFSEPAWPRAGSPLNVSYLGFCASQPGFPFARIRAAFLRHVAHVQDPRSICFWAENADQPRSFAHPLSITFSSTTFGFGEIPPSVTLDQHELTWI